MGGSEKLTRYPISLLELASGVWLGDMVLRDKPSIPLVPQEQGQGFGTTTKTRGEYFSSHLLDGGFAKWSIGVQKAAWRWTWNFDEDVQQIKDYGKAMGAQFAGSNKSLDGVVCLNEGLSRRIPKQQRMVYVDWGTHNSVSLLMDSFSIQVPRYLDFNKRNERRNNFIPFTTEFSVYQSGNIVGNNDMEANVRNQQYVDSSTESVEMDNLREVVCSKISRVYNFDGLLKQGCTSFYSLQRFGGETS